jgi:replication initiation and membrane attachment protein DnaB
LELTADQKVQDFLAGILMEKVVAQAVLQVLEAVVAQQTLLDQMVEICIELSIIKEKLLWHYN